MNDETYVKIWRGMIKTAFYKNKQAFKLAMHLILTAKYEEETITVGGKPLTLKSGQLFTSVKKLAEETGLTTRQTRTALALLKNCQFSTSETTSHGTIITIYNYVEYQTLKRSGRQAKRQTTDKRPTNAPIIKNLKNKTYDHPSGDRQPTKNEYSKSFQDWWELYPKKVGKLAAYRAWKKVGKRKDVKLGDLTDAIIAQMKGYHFRGRNGHDYIPNPSTWLNEGRWMDEIQPSPPKLRVVNGDGEGWIPEAERIIPDNPYAD